jgi:hypothetical protein
MMAELGLSACWPPKYVVALTQASQAAVRRRAAGRSAFVPLGGLRDFGETSP